MRSLVIVAFAIPLLACGSSDLPIAPEVAKLIPQSDQTQQAYHVRHLSTAELEPVVLDSLNSNEEILALGGRALSVTLTTDDTSPRLFYGTADLESGLQAHVRVLIDVENHNMELRVVNADELRAQVGTRQITTLSASDVEQETLTLYNQRFSSLAGSARSVHLVSDPYNDFDFTGYAPLDSGLQAQLSVRVDRRDGSIMCSVQNSGSLQAQMEQITDAEASRRQFELLNDFRRSFRNQSSQLQPPAPAPPGSLQHGNPYNRPSPMSALLRNMRSGGTPGRLIETNDPDVYIVERNGRRSRLVWRNGQWVEESL